MANPKCTTRFGKPTEAAKPKIHLCRGSGRAWSAPAERRAIGQTPGRRLAYALRAPRAPPVPKAPTKVDFGFCGLGGFAKSSGALNRNWCTERDRGVPLGNRMRDRGAPAERRAVGRTSGARSPCPAGIPRPEGRYEGGFWVLRPRWVCSTKWKLKSSGALNRNWCTGWLYCPFEALFKRIIYTNDSNDSNDMLTVNICKNICNICKSRNRMLC